MLGMENFSLSPVAIGPLFKPALNVSIFEAAFQIWRLIEAVYLQVAHTDVVLDDIWTFDLAKLDGWKCVKENTQGEEAFKEGSDWETDKEDNENSESE